MKAPVCVKCQVTMKVVKVGVTIVEMFGNPQRPYKLWPADVRKCPACGFQVTSGCPEQPIIQHFEDGFQEYLDRIPEENRVYDYENTHRQHDDALPIEYPRGRNKLFKT